MSRRSDSLARAAMPVVCAAMMAACSAPIEEASDTSNAAASTAFANDKPAYDYFIGKGFTNFQAAAIVGNLDQESGINPTISQENGGPGRGIAQWSAGGRWDSDPGDNVTAYAAQHGQSPMALGTQLDFIMFELNTFPGYGLAKLKASTNVTDATLDFESDFEGCNIASQCDANSRVNYAKAILSAYGNSGGGGSPPDAGTSPPPAGIHPHASSSLCLAASANANGSAVVVAACDGSAGQAWTFQGGALRVFGSKCLDVPSGNVVDGTKLQIWDCYAGNTNQTWARVGSTIQWTGRGKCLDLTDGMAAAGTKIQSWTCYAGSLNQEW